jgi:hypothetical protein
MFSAILFVHSYKNSCSLKYKAIRYLLHHCIFFNNNQSEIIQNNRGTIGFFIYNNYDWNVFFEYFSDQLFLTLELT